MVSCSFKSNYWDLDQKKETEFLCDNEPLTNIGSSLCGFHHPDALNAENIEHNNKEFQKKIDKYLTDKNHKPLLFIGYCLHDLKIENIEFSHPVYFDHAHISGSITINAKFLSHISFFNSQFSGKGTVNFSKCSFSNKGDVNFYKCSFSNENYVMFSDCNFFNKGFVSFFKTSFSNKGNVNFIGCSFSNEGNVSFSDSSFSNVGDVSFVGSFSNKGDVNFFASSFSNIGPVIFISQFSGKGTVNFSSSIFSNKGHFINQGNVSFYESNFSNEGDVNFSGSSFSNEGDVDFSRLSCSNKKDVNFSGSSFSNVGDVFFSGPFSNVGGVGFSHCNFFNKGFVSFSNFSNKGRVYFRHSIFSGTTYFYNCKFENSVFFNYVNLKSPEDVKFGTDDLSHVSFSNTDITRIIFGENTFFGKVDSEKEENRFKIFDERRFEMYFEGNDNNKNDKKDYSERLNISLGSVLSTYRNLRENYEYRLRYDEAGRFFIREMELKRKYRNIFSKKEKKYIIRKNGLFRRNFSFIGIYHFICKYGESSTKPLILFGIIIFSSTIYWIIFSSIDCDHFNLIHKSCNEDDISCSLMRTFSDIVGFPEEGKIIDYITRITSIIVLATLFLPFRRKFERRFRH